MFRGQFQHSIDAKGRVSLPARLRDALSSEQEPGLIMTPSPFDPCLHLYSLAKWKEFEAKIAALPSMNPTIVRFRRLYISPALDCELDKSGRLQISPDFRNRAKLEKEVLFAGMGNLIELWSRDLWEQALSMTPAEETQFRADVQELVTI